MNEETIKELETFIYEWKEGYKKYKLKSFVYEIERLEKIISLIRKKDFKYLSTEEAMLSHY